MATKLDDAAITEAPASARARPSALRTLLVAAAASVATLAVVAVAAVLLLPRLVPDLSEVFGTETVDRSGPAVLQALEDLSEYRAVTGTFQVILDVEEDARFLPSALRGERTLFVAVGTVDGVVDFSSLGPDAVEVSEDRTAVSIVLPPAHLSESRVDPERSYTYERRRGLLDRIGSVFSDNPTEERELYLLAQDRLAEAAQETELTAVAERNTRLMLDGLLRSLGFTDVDVAFRARR